MTVAEILGATGAPGDFPVDDTVCVTVLCYHHFISSGPTPATRRGASGCAPDPTSDRTPQESESLMTYLNEATIKQLQTYFQDVDKDVTLVLFNAPDAPYGEETEQVLRELADVSPHFALDVLDLEEDQDRAEAYGVTRAPAYVLLDETGTFTRVRFNGAPMGHEINALISALDRKSVV